MSRQLRGYPSCCLHTSFLLGFCAICTACFRLSASRIFHYDIVNLRLIDRRGIFSPIMLPACTALILCYRQHFLADLQLRGRMITSHNPTAHASWAAFSHPKMIVLVYLDVKDCQTLKMPVVVYSCLVKLFEEREPNL